ncbi:hypothetical protein [uncultured Parabacteroides sp.]|uniref:hypothetical protein n=1 Tax=uncultured Parabacteroides sp. TaxID=512312 RepID=UPI0025CE1328|nr:hypothetical protein [uncultured Parabacteroides sp.]
MIEQLKKDIENVLYIKNWRDVYISGIDGYIVNCAVLLIEEGYSNPNKWEARMRKIMYGILKGKGCNEEGWSDIVKNVWNSYYLMNEREESKLHRADDIKRLLPKVKDIAMKKGLVCLLLNNNIVFGGVLIMAAILSVIVIDYDDYYPRCIGYVGISQSICFFASLCSRKTYIWSPLIAFFVGVTFISLIILFNGDMFYLSFYSAIKGTIIKSMIFLLFFPVVYANRYRMYDPIEYKI